MRDACAQASRLLSTSSPAHDQRAHLFAELGHVDSLGAVLFGRHCGSGGLSWRVGERASEVEGGGGSRAVSGRVGVAGQGERVAVGSNESGRVGRARHKRTRASAWRVERDGECVVTTRWARTSGTRTGMERVVSCACLCARLLSLRHARWCCPVRVDLREANEAKAGPRQRRRPLSASRQTTGQSGVIRSVLGGQNNSTCERTRTKRRRVCRPGRGPAVAGERRARMVASTPAPSRRPSSSPEHLPEIPHALPDIQLRIPLEHP